MSYEPLHHKYRPQTFAHLVGQEAIAKTLTNAIKSDRIAPAYLFTGPRGTGKTSSARILAKSLNCQKSNLPTESPCGVCEVCKSIASASGAALDVIEIDAASNTGVDNIRDLIEKAQFAPVQCRYKVYVIDECHMLSVAAFNALLKTLEEPPRHVVFILATTDPQRVLPTIISRCQKFDFRRIPLDAMVRHLQDIATKEKINITTDALTLIAQVAQGGLRDAQSMLDQLSLLPEKVTVEGVWDLVGAVPEQDLLALTIAIREDNSEKVLDGCRQLMDRGREPLIVLQNMASFYRDLLIAKTAPSRHELVAVTPPTWRDICEFVKNIEVSDILQGQQHLKNSEVQIKNTTQPRLWLEVTLLGLLPSANTFRVANTTTQSSGQKSEVLKQELPKQPETGISPTNLNNFNSTPPHLSNGSNSGLNGNGKKPPTTPPVNHDAEGGRSHPIDKSQEQTPQPTYSELEQIEPVNSNIPQFDNYQPNIQEIWQQLINNLPFAPRSLLKEHGTLLSFKDSVAIIAIKNETLLKSAQKSLAKIEAAFAAIFRTKVKVNLEVKSSKSNPTSAQKPTTQNPYPESIPETNFTPPPLSDNKVESPNLSAPESKIQEIPSEKGEEVKGSLSENKLNPDKEIVNELTDDHKLAESSVNNTSPLTDTPSITPLSTPEEDYDADLVEQGYNSIKKFFEGDFIDLTDNSGQSASLINNQVSSNNIIEEENQQIEAEALVELDEIEAANNEEGDKTKGAAANKSEELPDFANFQEDEDDDEMPF